MKMKDFGPRGGHVPLAFPLDPPLLFTTITLPSWIHQVTCIVHLLMLG